MADVRKILFLNGPPGSGKDMLAAGLMQYDNDNLWRGFKFAALLKMATHILYGLPEYPTDYFEGPFKDIPTDLFLGLTPRQAYITVSEEMVKPIAGQDHFGRVGARMIHGGAIGYDVVISDSGFYGETVPVLLNDAGEVYEAAWLVRVHRTGHSYTGDSRSYLKGPAIDELFGDRQMDYINSHTSIERAQADFSARIAEFTKVTESQAQRAMAWRGSYNGAAAAAVQESMAEPLHGDGGADRKPTNLSLVGRTDGDIGGTRT